jgi:hypothetical protein
MADSQTASQQTIDRAPEALPDMAFTIADLAGIRQAVSR